MEERETVPAPYSPRRIGATALAGLKASVEIFGDLSGFVVNRRTKNIVCGHQRRAAAESIDLDAVKLGPVFTVELGYPGARFKSKERTGVAKLAGGARFPVRSVTWPLSFEKAANLAANNTAIQGEWTNGLAALLLNVREETPELYEAVMLEELLQSVGWTGLAAGSTDLDAVPAVEVTPVSRPGDLWLCGEHRVLCSDSTVSADVKRVMGGGVCDLVLTDPPYGVAYVGKTGDALEIRNDRLDEKGLFELIHAAFDMAEHYSRPGAYWYATVPAGPLHLLFADDWKQRGILRQILVWAKDAMVLGHSEYHYQHEPILFGWIPGKRHRNSDRTRTSLWEIARPKVSLEHPTMKPVELWIRAMRDGSRKSERVFDPFLGSGTTMIAAEQLGRRCCGIEIDPRYVDVIVRRYQEFTGKAATLDGDGRTFDEIMAERVGH